jgi:hypothetical protein
VNDYPDIADHGMVGDLQTAARNAAADQIQLDIHDEAAYPLAQPDDIGGFRSRPADLARRRATRDAGFVSPTDPDRLTTLDAMDEELVSDSLVHRYDPAASPDGLLGSEGTFNLCSFLYVEALARAGRLDQARYAFEKMLTYANHVGLFAEEIGPSGEQLGNFPQAFTHLALVAAALALDEQLDRAERRQPGTGHRPSPTTHPQELS